MGGQAAVRMGSWKAVRPGEKRPWATLRPPERPGRGARRGRRSIRRCSPRWSPSPRRPTSRPRKASYQDRSLHERDREAKYGDTRKPAAAKSVRPWPTTGLIPASECKLVRASSESTFNGRDAKHAVDGDPRTVWHTHFQGNVDEPPHELVLDLGKQRTVRGFRCMARQDAGWNGTIAKCEFFVSDFSRSVRRAGRPGNAQEDQGSPRMCPASPPKAATC